MLKQEQHFDNYSDITIVCFRSEFSPLPLFRGATLLVIEEGEETLSQWRSNVVEATELSMPTGTAYNYVNSKPFCEQSLVEILHDVPFIMLMVSAVHPSRKKAIQKLESSINNNNDVLTLFVTWDQPTLSIPKFLPVEGYNTCLFANSGQHAIELTRSIIEMITVPCLIGVDFADIKVTFSCKETLAATGSSGTGKGENRALAAACNGIENMEKNGLLHSVFICIHSPLDIELEEFTVICDEIEKELIDDECIMVCGIVYDPLLKDANEIRVEIITCSSSSGTQRRYKKPLELRENLIVHEDSFSNELLEIPLFLRKRSDD